jgi:hypothetical protein
MPSSPILQACRNTSSPLASVCSLSAIPTCTRAKQPRQAILALADRQGPVVDAVELQQVEASLTGFEKRKWLHHRLDTASSRQQRRSESIGERVEASRTRLPTPTKR